MKKLNMLVGFLSLCVLLLAFSTESEAREVDTTTVGSVTVSLKEIPSEQITAYDDKGNIIDSNEFTIYEEINACLTPRGWVMTKTITQVRNFWYGPGPGWIDVSIESGYKTPWVGRLYFQDYSKLQTIMGDCYATRYRGEVSCFVN